VLAPGGLLALLLLDCLLLLMTDDVH